MKIMRKEYLYIKIHKAPQAKHFQEFWVYKWKDCNGAWTMGQNLLSMLRKKY